MKALGFAPPRLAVLMPNSGNPFWQDLQDRLRGVGEEKNLKLEFFVPQSPDPVCQADCLRKLMNKGFNLVIANPMNDNNLADAVHEAAAQGIHVLDVGMKMRQDLVGIAIPYYVPVKTADFCEQGRIGASYIADRLLSKGGGGVVVIEGQKDAFQSRERCRGAAEVLSRIPRIHILDFLSADFDRNKARKLCLELMKRGDRIEAFFCANDEMALGVSDAEAIYGKHQDTIIVGVDGIEEACRGVVQGRISATVAFSRKEVAKVIIDAALKTLRCEEVEHSGHVQSFLLTRNNASSWDGE